jgi:hypothetical protein
MEIARLAARPGEEASGELVERPLLVMVYTSPTESGIIARKGLVAEGTWTSIFEDAREFDLVRHERGMAWLAPDNPFLDAAQKQRLDERGLVRVATVLHQGDLLASVLKTALPQKGRRSQPGKCWAVDNSWSVPPRWEGARVTDVRVLPRSELPGETPENVVSRVWITIRAEHVLGLGDVLLYRRQPIGILARFLPDDDMPRHGNRCLDLILPQGMADKLELATGECKELLLGKSFEPGTQAMQARAMEVYSLITKQPLLDTPCPGQVVSANQVGWLQARGLFGNLAELTSLKSDDLSNRSRLKLLFDSGSLSPASLPSAGAPESLLITQTYLRMLSLDSRLETAGNAVALSLRPADDEDILRWSSGQVRKAETLDYRTLDETPAGLFCPAVFGSPASTRRRRFGHVVLPCPVVSMLWRIGNPSALETMLDVPGQTIESILQNETWVKVRDNGWQLLPADEGHEPDGDARTGALAIEAMLQAVPVSKLPPGANGRPLVFVQRVVPVGPPEIRPLVLLDDGSFATADINDLYRQLINRANRLVKLEELRAPAAIIVFERRELQRIFDQLQANCLLPEADAVMREGEEEARLVDGVALLARQFISGDSKRVEWSGRARVIASENVPEGRVLVPRKVFDTLKLDGQSPVLLTSADRKSAAFVSLIPVPDEGAVLALPPRAFSQLELTGPVPLCVVHRPLGSAACAEARRLLEGAIEPIDEPRKMRGWFDAVDLDEFVSGLVEAALQGSRTVLDSPRGLLVGGTGSIAFAEDDELPCPGEKAQEVAEPAAETT